MPQCFIALGSNLEQPLLQVNRAVKALTQLPASQLIAVSRWYHSKAIGPGEQADYINGVVELQSSLPPLDLLNQLQQIESSQKRQRIQRWGPRTLDLDILFYGNHTINQSRLTIPHPRIMERNFVLYPLFDIAPSIHLTNDLTLQHHIKHCSMEGLSLVDPHSSPTIHR